MFFPYKALLLSVYTKSHLQCILFDDDFSMTVLHNMNKRLSCYENIFSRS